MKEKILSIFLEIKDVFIPKRPNDPLKGLKSSDSIRKERFKKYKTRVLSILIFAPILFFIVYLLIKTFFLYRAQFDQTAITQTIPKKELKLEFNTFTRWQEIKDQEDEKLNKDIEELSMKVDSVKEDVSLKIDESNKEINGSLLLMKNSVTETLSSNQEGLKKLLGEEREKNKDELNEVIDTFNTQLKSVQEDVSIRLKDLTVNGNSGNIAIELPKLPPIGGLNNAGANLADGTILDDLGASKLPFGEYEEEDITVEEEATVEPYSISTLENYDKKEIKKDKEMPKFTIMPGFLQGVIVAGADVPTLERSATEPKPIWLSINSEQLIANSKFSNMKDCLIEAIATGDIGTKRGRFALKQLSCSLTDLVGNDYKIVTPIKGNVYGEDGKIGAKGRLVSREGEIIAKGVPLATLEGLIQTMSKANTYVYPSGNGVSNAPNPLDEFADAGSSTGSKILSKFSEYYLKILESLNPYIEIKAKRVVTIAISDAIEVTPVKYTPFDVNYFVERDLLEEEDQDEEDY